MSVLRSGSTKKYAEGWENVFGKRKATGSSLPGKSRASTKASPKKTKRK